MRHSSYNRGSDELGMKGKREKNKRVSMVPCDLGTRFGRPANDCGLCSMSRVVSSSFVFQILLTFRQLVHGYQRTAATFSAYPKDYGFWQHT